MIGRCVTSEDAINGGGEGFDGLNVIGREGIRTEEGNLMCGDVNGPNSLDRFQVPHSTAPSTLRTSPQVLFARDDHSHELGSAAYRQFPEDCVQLIAYGIGRATKDG